HADPFVSQHGTKRLQWVSCKTAYFALAQMPLTIVLVAHQDGGEGTDPVREQEEGWDAVLCVVLIGDLEAVVVVFLDHGVCLEWHSVVRDAELQERTDFL